MLPQWNAIALTCEGMGDCLVAMAVIREICALYRKGEDDFRPVVFTHHPELFAHCPYVERAYSIHDEEAQSRYDRGVQLFDLKALPYNLMDTFDFMTIPLGIGTLDFRQKRLEYFPGEEDRAERFDVLLNTSQTWSSRSWPLERWQRLADHILRRGFSVGVVGKDVVSVFDKMVKVSQPLPGCADLTNRLSLDQTWYHIRKCGLFVTCQNGLSVLAGTTDAEIVVLDRSIHWSKYAIYRNESPHYKFTLVRGNCDVYCTMSHECPRFAEFRCVPTYEQVVSVVDRKLAALTRLNGASPAPDKVQERRPRAAASSAGRP